MERQHVNPQEHLFLHKIMCENYKSANLSRGTILPSFFFFFFVLTSAHGLGDELARLPCTAGRVGIEGLEGLGICLQFLVVFKNTGCLSSNSNSTSCTSLGTLLKPSSSVSSSVKWKSYYYQSDGRAAQIK